MKKLAIIMFLILTQFAFADEPKKWLQISNNVFVNENMARFITGTNLWQAIVEFKIDKIENKQKRTMFGLYSINCLADNIEIGKIYKYDSNNKLISSQQIGAKIPSENYEKTIVNYMCTTRRNYMLNLYNELEKLDRELNDTY